MAIYDVKTKHVLNKYLDIDMTLSIDEITGYGGTRSDLLKFMKDRHHNLVGGSNLTRTPDNTIKNNARDPEKPIYVSYLPKELENINRPADTDAIYYLKDIGIMVISKLKNDK
jgi:CRISPR-associated endonuclease/helicase Cas3